MRWFAAICTLAVLGLLALWFFGPNLDRTVGEPVVIVPQSSEPNVEEATLSEARRGTTEPSRLADEGAAVEPGVATAESREAPLLGRLYGRILDCDGLPATFANRYRIVWVGDDKIERRSEGELSFEGHFDTGPSIDGSVHAVELRIASSARWNAYGVEPIEVRPGDSIQHDLTLPARCEFHLRFTDAETGEPIVGAEIEGLDTSTRHTDEEGRYDISSFIALPGEPAHFTLEHPDYPPFRGKLRCPDPPWPTRREYAVPSGMALRARVESATGEPLPGLQVHCSASIGARTGIGRREVLAQKTTLTDDEGRFTLRGFAPGLTYRFRVERDRKTVLCEELVFPEASSRKTFVVHSALSTVGLVLDASGAPLPNTAVIALGPRGAGVSTATTDAEGSFRLDDLYPGDWLAYVEYGQPFPGSIAHLAPRRIVSRHFRVEASGAERVDLRLPQEARPTVRIPFSVFALNAIDRTAAPLAGFYLNGIDSTLSENAFVLDSKLGFPYAAPAGRYELVARAHGYEPAVIEFELKPGAAPQRVEAELIPFD